TIQLNKRLTCRDIHICFKTLNRIYAIIDYPPKCFFFDKHDDTCNTHFGVRCSHYIDTEPYHAAYTRNVQHYCPGTIQYVKSFGFKLRNAFFFFDSHQLH
ncbi:hypothetical protein KCU73_g14379, partial [Aureobasidium melanogenum]